MRKLMATGMVLLILGVVGLAIPYFTTSQTKDIAQVGDVKLQTSQSTGHTIPPMVAGAVAILGGLLLAAGFFKKA